MTRTDIVTNVARILGWVGSPLLIKWGLDAESSEAVLGGAAALVGTAVWFFFYVRNKKAA
jgi:hypothetical protein